MGDLNYVDPLSEFGKVKKINTWILLLLLQNGALSESRIKNADRRCAGYGNGKQNLGTYQVAVHRGLKALEETGMIYVKQERKVQGGKVSKDYCLSEWGFFYLLRNSNRKKFESLVDWITQNIAAFAKLGESSKYICSLVFVNYFLFSKNADDLKFLQNLTRKFLLDKATSFVFAEGSGEIIFTFLQHEYLRIAPVFEYKTDPNFDPNYIHATDLQFQPPLGLLDMWFLEWLNNQEPSLVARLFSLLKNNGGEQAMQYMTCLFYPAIVKVHDFRRTQFFETNRLMDEIESILGISTKTIRYSFVADEESKPLVKTASEGVSIVLQRPS